jgi:AcrR family transcriptional regulator
MMHCVDDQTARLMEIHNGPSLFRKLESPSPHLTEHLCIVKYVTIADSPASKIGRPRSTRMHAIICDAVLELVSGGATLSSLSLVSISRDTGISRNSIYRRWKSKEQLYSDVVKSIERQLPDLTEQSARENLFVLIKTFDGVERSERRMEQAVVAEAQNFPDLHEQYLIEIVAPLDHAMKLAIRRGKETREIRADVDENLLAEVLVSSVSAAMSSNDREGQDFESVSRRIIDLVFDGVSPK